MGMVMKTFRESAALWRQTEIIPQEGQGSREGRKGRHAKAAFGAPAQASMFADRLRRRPLQRCPRKALVERLALGEGARIKASVTLKKEERIAAV